MANAQVKLRRARKALRSGRLQDAQTACLEAMDGDSANPEGLILLGEIAWAANALDQAMDLFYKAHLRQPERIKPLVWLARCLAAAHRIGPAKAAAERAVTLGPRDAESLYLLGSVYGQVGNYAGGLALLERAVARAPRKCEYLFDLGYYRQVAGDLEGAERAFRRSIEVDPSFVAGYAPLVEMRQQSPESNVIPALERLFAQPTNDIDRSLTLGHALAKSYEDLGDFDAALGRLKRAKAVRRNRTRYDATADQALFAAATGTFPGPEIVGRPLESDAPIFVIGMPRSGTTLTDRILTSHPDVASVGELQAFALLVHRLARVASPHRLQAEALARGASVDVGALAAGYLKEATAICGPSRRFVDKLPFNFLFAGLIQRALPNARIVCLRREPIDVCISNYRTFFNPSSAFHDYAYDLEDIARYYVLFDALVAHWSATLPPDRFMSLSYEALVYNQQAETRRLLSFCGLAWDARCLDFHENGAGVETPSLHQVRSPMFKTSIGRWRRYGDALNPMIDILRDAGVV